MIEIDDPQLRKFKKETGLGVEPLYVMLSIRNKTKGFKDLVEYISYKQLKDQGLVNVHDDTFLGRRVINFTLTDKGKKILHNLQKEATFDSDAVEVLEHLIETKKIAGLPANFRVNPSTVKLAKRWLDKYTVEDFKLLHEHFVREWKDLVTDGAGGEPVIMNRYLLPKNLYNIRPNRSGNTFETRLDEAKAAQAEKAPPSAEEAWIEKMN